MWRKLFSPVFDLAEDFFEQSLVIKGFIAFGWLCILVMLFSMLPLA